jgi:hypothetical protein
MLLLFTSILLVSSRWLHHKGSESMDPPDLASKPTDRIVLVKVLVEPRNNTGIAHGCFRIKLDDTPFLESGVMCMHNTQNDHCSIVHLQSRCELEMGYAEWLLSFILQCRKLQCLGRCRHGQASG